MKKYGWYIALMVLVLIGYGGYLVYERHFSNEGILEKVMSREGYRLTEIANPVAVTVHILPEWIPAEEQASREKLDITLTELHNTRIVLDSVWHRGSDIYFDFSVAPKMKYKGGEFLYSFRINPDGTVTDLTRPDFFEIMTPDGETVGHGQYGFGPGPSFGFAIDAAHYGKIKNGFGLTFNGLIRYEYAKS